MQARGVRVWFVRSVVWSWGGAVAVRLWCDDDSLGFNSRWNGRGGVLTVFFFFFFFFFFVRSCVCVRGVRVFVFVSVSYVCVCV